LILALIMLTSNSLAQSETKPMYSKARIYLKDHEVLKAKNLEMNSIEATFLNIDSNEKSNMPMDKINFIKVKHGSHLLEGSLYGAASMALSAVLIDANKNSISRPKDFGAKDYVAFTLVGAGVGGIVGSLFPKWKTVFSDGEFIGQHLPFKIGFDASHDLAVLKITIPL